jgi:hypothetical protein
MKHSLIVRERVKGYSENLHMHPGQYPCCCTVIHYCNSLKISVSIFVHVATHFGFIKMLTTHDILQVRVWIWRLRDLCKFSHIMAGLL